MTNLEHKNIISKTVQAIFWLISYNFIAWISQSFTKIYKNYWKIRKNEKYYIKSNSNNFLSDFKLFYGLDFQSLYIIKKFLKTFEHANYYIWNNSRYHLNDLERFYNLDISILIYVYENLSKKNWKRKTIQTTFFYIKELAKIFFMKFFSIYKN